jgi:hypothetical protein
MTTATLLVLACAKLTSVVGFVHANKGGLDITLDPRFS